MPEKKSEKKRPELQAMVREQFINNLKAFPREIHQTLGALFRAGLKDLQAAVLNPFPEHHVANHEEPGMPFMPPQYEVANLGRPSERTEVPTIIGRQIKEQEID